MKSLVISFIRDEQGQDLVEYALIVAAVGLALITTVNQLSQGIVSLYQSMTGPNRWFPIEQHLLTPLVHWLPKHWQRVIVPRFTVWDALVRPSPDRREFYLTHYLNDVRLLSAAELAALFPDARLIRERLCGWTKSLVAVRPYSKRNDR